MSVCEMRKTKKSTLAVRVIFIFILLVTDGNFFSNKILPDMSFIAPQKLSISQIR